MIFCRCYQKKKTNKKIIDNTKKNKKKKEIIEMILFVNKNTIIPTN